MKYFNKKPVVLIFSEIKWEWSHTITQKLALQLSAHYNVIYISSRRELREAFKKILQIKIWKNMLKKINNSLLIVQAPIVFPKIYKINNFDYFVNRLYHFFVKCTAKIVWGKSKIIILVFEPHFSDYINFYNYDKMIYFPYDHFGKYTYFNSDKKTDTQISNHDIEHALIEKADFFYTVSENLSNYYYEKYKFRPKIIPNATSNNYFIDEINPSLAKKADDLLKGIPGIKVGYSGGIKGVLQLESVINISKEFPSHSFVFMGRIIYTNIPEFDEKLKLLFDIKNVYYIGQQSAELLPYLLKRMDILIMLYSSSKNVWTYYGDPAKLFEYMATGKPIFSTPHPVVNKYSNYITIFNNDEDFKVLLEQASALKNSIARNKRIMLARLNTWETRVKEIKKDIEA